MQVTHGVAAIPLIGLGTWELRGRACARVVEQALRLGYRHIDTAEAYENEREIGEGLRASGVDRQQVFITTKVWPSHFSPRELDRSAKESLARLRVTEVDLLLLHWPSPTVPLSETIGALNKAREDGLTRHIGVSNFTVGMIEEATRLSFAPLACNQFEYHPFLDQSKVVAACRRHGLDIVAYSPIARGGVKNNELLARIGKGYGKSPAQVSLRWLVQQGIAAVPRTSKIERLSENMSVFDFELTDDEMREIAALGSSDGRIVDSSMSPRWD